MFVDLDQYYNNLMSIHGSTYTPVEDKKILHEDVIDHPSVSADSSLNITEEKRKYFDSRLVLKSNRTIKEVFIHQSMIKAMTFKGDRRDFCALKLYKTYITCEIRSKPTMSMQKGNYFEAHALNGGIDKNGDVLTLPLLRGNKKSADHLRIDEQVFNFKNNIVPQLDLIIDPQVIWRQFTTLNADPTTREDFPFDIFIELETDLISQIHYKSFQHDLAVIDLKLTIDRNGCFGEFCWGEPEKMDNIQAYLYSFALSLPFFYLVIDYKRNDRGWKLVPVNTDINDPDPKSANIASVRKREMFQTIRTVVSEIEHHHKNGWKTTPMPENCITCPIYDCKDRNTIKTI